MKKIYLFLAGVLVSTFAISQSQSRQSQQNFNFANPRTPGHMKVTGHVPKPHPSNSPNAMMSFYLDYDSSDAYYQTQVTGIPGYSRYIWNLNMRYKESLGDTNLTFAVVDLSQLVNSYDPPTPLTTYNYYDFQTGTLHVDSVWVIGGWENNTSTRDTLTCKIIQLSGTGFPTQPATVLNTTSIYSNDVNGDWPTASTSWLSIGQFAFAPNYTIPSPNTHIGIQIEYYGGRTDTFGILAGFGDQGGGQCSGHPTLPFFAEQSHYWPCSYRYDQRFNPYVPTNTFYGIFPTSTGVDTYYDCNGDNMDQAGTDSQDAIQNWNIVVKFSGNFNTGIADYSNGVTLSQNTPNPSNGTTTINYQLANAGNVSLNVVDVTGKNVMTVNEGQRSAGKYAIDLNTNDLQAGIYFYTLTVDGNRMTKKLTVIK